MDGWMENINTIHKNTEASAVVRKGVGRRQNGEKANYK
jgi:hypothetical protein